MDALSTWQDKPLSTRQVTSSAAQFGMGDHDMNGQHFGRHHPKTKDFNWPQRDAKGATKGAAVTKGAALTESANGQCFDF